MKRNTIICSFVTLGLVVGLTACSCCKEGRESKASKAKLEAQAKVTKAEAEQIALAKAPGGTIKEGELEKEKGKLLWSFDIATPDTKEITEVQVDAITGAVLDVSKESVAEQEKETKEDANKKEKQEDEEKEEKK